MQHYNYYHKLSLLDNSDEYDGDEGKSDDGYYDNYENQKDHASRIRNDIFSNEDIEGKNDYQNDVEDIDDINISDDDTDVAVDDVGDC